MYEANSQRHSAHSDILPTFRVERALQSVKTMKRSVKHLKFYAQQGYIGARGSTCAGQGEGIVATRLYVYHILKMSWPWLQIRSFFDLIFIRKNS